MIAPLLISTQGGIYCQRADVYIDPSRSCKEAIITHAHSDHARGGMDLYHATVQTADLMRSRISSNLNIQEYVYGGGFVKNEVKFSFHCAGHVLGSAQIRVEYQNEVWVVTGDYKIEDDGVSGAYEQLQADHFITESTFALPVFKWEKQSDVFKKMNNWWSCNAKENIFSIIYAYSLGKAQRVLSGLSAEIGEIYVHPSVHKINKIYEKHGVVFPKTTSITGQKSLSQQGLLISPMGITKTENISQIKKYEEAFASGWMMFKGIKNRRSFDMGFALSDHVDWDDLNRAVLESKASCVYPVHGYTKIYSRYLNEKGIKTGDLKLNIDRVE